MSSIEEIKARIDIVELVSDTVQLRRTGKNYIGFCPFHSNTRTPAFVVFPESGTWRCFGQCNEGGDIFGYLMKKEGWDFSEALHYLAEKAGIQLRTPTTQERAEGEEHDALRSLLEDSATFYRQQLINTPAGQQSLEYLKKRGLTAETIEVFGLGYAPNTWDAILKYFMGRKKSEQDLLDAGLVVKSETRGLHDRFRHRIIFPIRDERGRMAGFGGRILNPEDVPKFLNSPQTPIFDKGHLLYGLERAKKSIRSADQAVIVEGYLDVIALHQAGFSNTVSPMGTALTDRHLHLLKRYTHRIVLALDPDAAGAQATMRGLEIARQTLDRSQDPVFDARGLLGFESRLQADIRVTTLPEGMDPDDVVIRDPKEWEHILEQAKPIVIHVMETLAASRDVNDPKVKEEIASRVLPLIQDIASPIERDAYLQRLARTIRVDERSLLGMSVSPARKPFRRQSAVSEHDQTRVVSRKKFTGSAIKQESYTLGIMLRHPELIYRLDRRLQAAGLPRMTAADFQQTDHQTIMRLVQESVGQDTAEPINYVLSKLSLPMMETADRLLVASEKLDPNDERVVDDIFRAILDLRQRSIRQNIEYLRFMMEDAKQEGDLRATQFEKYMVQHSLTLLKINQALGK